MKKMALKLVLLVVVFAVALSGCTSNTATYPAKEIRVIIPYSTGATSDLIARKIAQIVQDKKLLPKPMVIVNIPGSGTREAVNTVQHAKNDGYTLLLHHSALLTMNNLGQMPTSYNDFDLVAQTLEVPIVIAVRKDAPWNTLGELLADAKQNPGKISWSQAGGVGSVVHFAAEMILQATGTQSSFRNIVYPGGAEAAVAQLGGQVDVRSSSSLDAQRYVDSGQLKLLAVSTDQRVPALPNVPSYKELGINETMILRSGYFAPRNTPPAVIEALQKAIKAAVESPEFAEFARQQVATAKYLNSKEWKEKYDADNIAIKKVAEKIKK